MVQRGCAFRNAVEFPVNELHFAFPFQVRLGTQVATSFVAMDFDSVDVSRLQFRAEAVNSFNNVNYQGPVVNLNSTPSVFVAAAQPRIIQFGLKLTF